MAKKRGVSLEEKRTRIQGIFFERPEVFTLKEIENIGSKEKGVVAQSIKDVLQGLVDDSLVETDKIGAGNFFWALPSSAGQARRTKINALKRKVDEARRDLEEAKTRKKSLLSERKTSVCTALRLVQQ